MEQSNSINSDGKIVGTQIVILGMLLVGFFILLFDIRDVREKLKQQAAKSQDSVRLQEQLDTCQIVNRGLLQQQKLMLEQVEKERGVLMDLLRTHQSVLKSSDKPCPFCGRKETCPTCPSGSTLLR